MRLCVISNSHAASLKDGWNAISNSLPGTDVTFFAAPNRLMAEVNANLDKKTLCTDNQMIKNILSFTSGGLEVIDITQYDAFLVYGLFLPVPRLDSRHSSAVKKATVTDCVNDSINYRFVADLCNMTSVPVFYSPNPLESEYILNDTTLTPGLYDTYTNLCALIDTNYDYSNAVQVKQMTQTMAKDLTTQEKYSKGSVRLTRQRTEHVSHDVMHTNAEYGEAYMKMFLQEELPKTILAVKNVA